MWSRVIEDIVKCIEVAHTDYAVNLIQLNHVFPQRES